MWYFKFLDSHCKIYDEMNFFFKKVANKKWSNSSMDVQAALHGKKSLFEDFLKASNRIVRTNSVVWDWNKK